MKISKSKQELARIISENDGWIAGNFASQQDDGEVWFSAFKPKWKTRCGTFDADYEGHFTIGHLIANRHQTILSRDEYSHLYPAPDADGWIEWSGGMFAPVIGSVVVDVMYANGAIGFEVNGDSVVWEHKKTPRDYTKVVAYRPHKPESGVETPEPGPTIEQLAADYRKAKDYAERKKQEADEAKAEAEAKLAELVAAGKALGLVLSVAAPEPELVITDWRDLQVGDVVEGRHYSRAIIGEVIEIDEDCHDNRPLRILEDGGQPWWVTSNEVKFIRRP